MLVFRQKMIYREDLKSNPTILYIFGDNLERQGFGGQAREMRGEPNAFGIATKRSISHNYPDDYFFDHQDDVIPILTKEFVKLGKHLMNIDIYNYDAVIIPMDGIGTGLSRMPELAPKALKFIDKQFKLLEDI